MPPCPGIDSPKSLTLKVRFRPEAKKPPKGAIREAKVAKTRLWNCIGAMWTTGGMWKGVKSGSSVRIEGMR